MGKPEEAGQSLMLAGQHQQGADGGGYIAGGDRDRHGKLLGSRWAQRWTATVTRTLGRAPGAAARMVASMLCQGMPGGSQIVMMSAALSLWGRSRRW